MDSIEYFIVGLGLIVAWKFLSRPGGEKLLDWVTDGLVKFAEALVDGEVKRLAKGKSPVAMAEEGMKVLKTVLDTIKSMGKTMEAIASKLQVEVETPKPEAAPEVVEVESEAEAEEEAEAVLPELVAGRCQALKKDGTQCKVKVPKDTEGPWVCGMHRPVEEEKTAAE